MNGNYTDWFDHPWLGTQHCLRKIDDNGNSCMNDHTGCIYNDGNNGCCYIELGYDSPLLKKE